MRAIHHIQTASDELTKLQSEVLRLEQRFQTAHRIFLKAAEAIRFEQQRARRVSVAAATPHHRLMGQPLKVNPEFSARVQQALGLETKKEAETGGKIHYVQRHALQRWILRERHERKGPAGFLFSQRPTLESRPHLSTLRHEFFKVGRACAG